MAGADLAFFTKVLERATLSYGHPAGAAITSYQTAGTNGDGATRHLRA